MKKTGGTYKKNEKNKTKNKKNTTVRNGEAGGDGEEHEPGGRVLLLSPLSAASAVDECDECPACAVTQSSLPAAERRKAFTLSREVAAGRNRPLLRAAVKSEVFGSRTSGLSFQRKGLVAPDKLAELLPLLFFFSFLCFLF